MLDLCFSPFINMRRVIYVKEDNIRITSCLKTSFLFEIKTTVKRSKFINYFNIILNMTIKYINYRYHIKTICLLDTQYIIHWLNYWRLNSEKVLTRLQNKNEISVLFMLFDVLSVVLQHFFFCKVFFNVTKRYFIVTFFSI